MAGLPTSFLRHPNKTRKPRRTWLALPLLAGFNFLLFVPQFIFRDHAPELFPKLPSEGGWLWRLRELGSLLTFRRPDHDPFRFSADFAALLLVVVLGAVIGRARLSRGLAVAAYLLLALFLTYHHAISYFFARVAALGEDIRLAKNLAHYAGDWLTPRNVIIGLGGLLVVVLLGALLSWSLRQLQEGFFVIHRGPVLLATLVLFALSWKAVTPFVPHKGDPAFQFLVRYVDINVEASITRAEVTRALLSEPEDNRYQPFGSITLLERPNVYLLMVEAYGHLAAACDTRELYSGVVRRVEGELGAKGLRMRSAYSRAPVRGGLSWLSIASVQTGTEIDQPAVYALLEPTAHRAPTMTSFFRQMGYQTVTLQPGNRFRPGLPRADIFDRDHVFEYGDLDYTGIHYTWGGVPDQYSLQKYRNDLLPKLDDARPRFTFYMGISTHHPWARVPPVVSDFHTLGVDREPPPPGDDARWPGLPGRAAITDATRLKYLGTVEYEWRSLMEFIAQMDARDAEAGHPPSLFLVLGDHQPRLECPDQESNFLAPFHVLSRDADLVASFGEAGLTEGLFADPDVGGSLEHRGIFSLVVRKLAERHADPASLALATYYPQGIRLTSVLKRPDAATRAFDAAPAPEPETNAKDTLPTGSTVVPAVVPLAD